MRFESGYFEGDDNCEWDCERDYSSRTLTFFLFILKQIIAQDSLEKKKKNDYVVFDVG